MGRLAGAGDRHEHGLYAELLERGETRVARWGRDTVCADGAVFHYPRFRIEASRAGEPVTVSAQDLPRWAREGVDCPVVHPDDSIVFVDRRVEQRALARRVVPDSAYTVTPPGRVRGCALI